MSNLTYITYNDYKLEFGKLDDQKEESKNQIENENIEVTEDDGGYNVRARGMRNIEVKKSQLGGKQEMNMDDEGNNIRSIIIDVDTHEQIEEAKNVESGQNSTMVFQPNQVAPSSESKTNVSQTSNLNGRTSDVNMVDAFQNTTVFKAPDIEPAAPAAPAPKRDMITDCCICLDSFSNAPADLQLIKTQCQHIFHENCLKMWINSRIGEGQDVAEPDCPSCREKFKWRE